MKFYTIILLLILLCLPALLFADTVHLKNGDKVSGTIQEENTHRIILESDIFGTLEIKREMVSHLEYTKNPLPDTSSLNKKTQDTTSVEWVRSANIGYSKTSGNSSTSDIPASLFMNRKTYKDEITIEGDLYYSTSNRKMNNQKWYGMARYAYSFWKRKWYNFYRIEADHDRFANIDYRLVPVGGIGYWFSDKPPFKCMLEGGLGYEHTVLRKVDKDETSTVEKDNDEGQMILVARAFAEKTLYKSLVLSEDLNIYPSTQNWGDYRLRFESLIKNPINDCLSLCLSYIIHYNSNPSNNAKKKDSQIVSSLEYAF